MQSLNSRTELSTFLICVVVGCGSCVAPAGETSEDAPTGSSDGSPSEGGASSDSETAAEPESDARQAAMLACAARSTIPAVSVPTGGGAYLENGFRIPNELPVRFAMDTLSPEIEQWPEDLHCYDVRPPQDTESDWWFTGDQWLEPDGTVHVYMATRGVDQVSYYGSNETGPDSPGDPVTASVMFDVSDLCPELPNLWIPDVADHPTQAGRICMHHTDDEAEALFVRVP